MARWSPVSLEDLKTYSLRDRPSKVGIRELARPWRPGGSLAEWVRSLPGILAAADFRDVVNSIVDAHRRNRTVILAMGAHAIKVGLSPVLLDWMDRGIITGLALNGAGVIHDAELAMVGATSEDVAAEIGAGRFGMAEETAVFINRAVAEGAQRGMGLGAAVGSALVKSGFPYARISLLARAYELDMPLTVHVAMGTDIIHAHPSMDPAATGRASHLDFRLFARLVSTLQGGVFINLGSAVILPEVFLKALSLVRNLGHTVREMTTVNMDFIRHYRPMTNVVQRPTLEGGKGYSLVGHHEIMFPLLAASVIEALQGVGRGE